MLLVDDDETFRERLGRLRDRGFEVCTAASVDEAAAETTPRVRRRRPPHARQGMDASRAEARRRRDPLRRADRLRQHRHGRRGGAPRRGQLHPAADGRRRRGSRSTSGVRARSPGLPGAQGRPCGVGAHPAGPLRLRRNLRVRPSPRDPPPPPQRNPAPRPRARPELRSDLTRRATGKCCSHGQSRRAGSHDSSPCLYGGPVASGARDTHRVTPAWSAIGRSVGCGEGPRSPPILRIAAMYNVPSPPWITILPR